MKQQILQKAIDDTLFYLELLQTEIIANNIPKREIINRVQSIRSILKKESA